MQLINIKMNSTPNSRGFTLLEIMVVTAIIGLLMSIAIPQYQSYVTRVRVQNGFLEAIEPIKRAVQLSAAVGNRYPTKDELIEAVGSDPGANGWPVFNRYVTKLKYNTIGNSPIQARQQTRLAFSVGFDPDLLPALRESVYGSSPLPGRGVLLYAEFFIINGQGVMQCYVASDNPPNNIPPQYAPRECPLLYGSANDLKAALRKRGYNVQ